MTYVPMYRVVGDSVMIGRIIAGRRDKNSSLPRGTHGTLTMIERTFPAHSIPADFQENSRCIEISRNIPAEHRGKKLGTRLLEEVEKIAGNNGFDWVWARTKHRNKVAIRTYQKADWQCIAEDSEYVYYGKKV